MNASSRFLMPLLAVFVSIALLLFFLKDFAAQYNIDVLVIQYANLLFLVLNIISFLFQKKALTNTNPNVFIRSVIAGMMLKMFGCAIAVIIYVTSIGNTYNKKAVFISLFIYLIYLATEVSVLMHINKRKNA